MSPREEEFVYFVNEREHVRQLKEAGYSKPWSADRVFQTTYFCNIRREDDKTTRWLRAHWLVDDERYEFAMVLARLVNRIDTLHTIGYPYQLYTPEQILDRVRRAQEICVPFWGNAYVVTTHGQRIDKLSYLIGLLRAAHKALPLIGVAPTCAAYHKAFKTLEGFSDFMAAQIVADLKNTVFHPLAQAEDWWTFVAMGPGSKRGMNWLIGEPVDAPMTKARFEAFVEGYQKELALDIPTLCNQDFQNCLCEFDKYMRVKYGTGRSKRKYCGAA